MIFSPAKIGRRVRQLMIICEHGVIKKDCNNCLAYVLYKACKYCKKLFLPNRPNQIRCTDCSEKDFNRKARS